MSYFAVSKFRIVVETGQNRSESLCVDLRAQYGIFWAWFGPALGPNPPRNRIFPAGSLHMGSLGPRWAVLDKL